MGRFRTGVREGESAVIYDTKKIEDIALQAAEMPEFKEAVEKEKGKKLEAIRQVRILLQKHFPEIKNLPKPEIKEGCSTLIGSAPNDFMVAKNIVDLLYEKIIF